MNQNDEGIEEVNTHLHVLRKNEKQIGAGLTDQLKKIDEIDANFDKINDGQRKLIQKVKTTTEMVQDSNEFLLVAVILLLVLLGSGILFFIKCD